ncbi:holo-ACP synthase [Glaciecola sp. 2405UD65-10]|jgi:holo-[acyl-carrier protein] synthase|uniref:holo-ACP synthase n=1 Tax=Glaciecola sp. 2405UD65-10 TaxID=3397244 RepID=UPI003B5AA6D1
MIVGIGNDIVEIARIEKAMNASERFAQRILTEFELQEYFASKAKARYLAKKFASKEALAKALGTGIGNGLSWQMIQIEHDELGKPMVVPMPPLLDKFNDLKVVSCHISISDEVEYATAMVVLES